MGTFQKKTEEFLKEHKRNKRWVKAIISLCLVASLFVGSVLSEKGFALTEDETTVQTEMVDDTASEVSEPEVVAEIVPDEQATVSAEQEAVAEETATETTAPAEEAKAEEEKTEETAVEEAVLSGTVKQEVIVLEDKSRQIKYTVRVTNSAEKTASEDTTVKAVLPATLVYTNGEQTSAGITVAGQEVSFANQSIAAGETKAYVFYANVNEGVKTTSEITTAFYINEAAIEAGNISWVNENLLSPTEVALTTTCAGVTITVSGSSDVLPEGTEVKATSVNKSAAIEAIEENLGEEQEVADAVAFDITLVRDGEEVQPEGEVKVSFDNLPFETLEENQEVIVAHLPDSLASATEMSTETADEETVVFDTTHFSVYAVAVLDSAKKIESAYTAQNSFSYTYGGTTYSSVAFDFHIFAKDVKVNNHTNGNIACETYDGSGSAFGTNQNKSDGVLEYNYIQNSATGVGQIASGVLVVGNNVSATVADNGNAVQVGTGGVNLNKDSATVYKEQTGSDAYIDIDQELTKLSNLSAALAGDGNTITLETIDADQNNGYKQYSNDDVIVKVPNSQNSKIEITVKDTASKDVVIVNMKATDLMANRSNKRELVVKGITDKTLIVNVDMTGVPANQLEYLVTCIDGYSNGEAVVQSNCNLLWNLYQKNGDTVKTYSNTEGYSKVGCSDYFMGTILAPGANVQYGALNGTVIAQNAKSNGQESHNWRYTGLSIKVNVNKTLSTSKGGTYKFYFGVFTDAAGTNRVEGTRIQSVTLAAGETATTTFANLQQDTTYYVFETNSVGVPVASGGEYVVVGNGQAVNVAAGNTSADVSIINTDEDMVSEQPKAKKVVSGTGTPSGATFTFKIEGIDGTTLPNGYESTKTVTDGQWAAFGTIEYKTEGTYKYKITEVVPAEADKVPGVTYSTQEVIMTVNVTKGADNKLAKTVTYTGGDEAGNTITNTYTQQSVKAQPKVNKELAGNVSAAPKNVDYTFTIAAGENTTLPDGYATTKTAKAGETAAFDEIEYTAEGTYKYEITEVVPETKIEGMTYSTQKVIATVVVAKDSAGKLASTVTYSGGSGTNKDTFTNTYKEAKTRLHIKKTVSGKGAPAEQFTFNLTAKDGAPTTTTASSTIASGQTGYFGEITYRAAGTYTYEISEVVPAEADRTPGMTYATEPITATVVVSEDANGALSVADPVYKDANDKETDTITNTYDRNKVKAQPQAKKVLSGKGAPKDATFTFEIAAKEGTTLPEKYETSKTVRADETATFDAITYSEAGTYTYTITEVVPADKDKVEGVTYSGQTITVTVTVGEDASGNLTQPVTTYEGGDGTDQNTITNTYERSKVKAQPQAKKVVSGKGAPKDAEFTFQISEVVAEGKAATLPGDYVTTKTVKADETAVFAEIEYSEVGTYVYEITEVEPATKIEGMTYSGQTITMTVSVTENASGNLEKTVTYDGGDGENKDIITNTYDRNKVKAQPQAKKVVAGNVDKAPANTEYKFVIAAATGTTLPDGYVTEKTVKAGETATFAPIEYSEAGTYVYEITEAEPETKIEGMTYSSQKITMTVVVGENETENLVIESVTYDGGDDKDKNTITNTYREAKTRLHIKKTVSGKGAPAEQFTFNLTAKDGAPTTTTASTTISSGQTGYFGEITYRTAGTYTYEIKEQIPETKTPGMTYATEPVTVTVVVSEDENGALSVADPVYKDANDKETDTITNTYDRAKVKVQPQAKKVVSGKGAPKDATFTFVIAAKEGTTLPEKYETSKTVKAGETANFAEIEYGETGTYKYVISEEVPETKIKGMTYSDQKIEITVEVTEDKTGNLVKKVTYDGGDGENKDIITNTYDREKVKAQPKVSKEMIGNVDKAPADATFTFAIAAKEGTTLPEKYETAQTVKAGETATFGEITYSEAGTYEYVISEVEPETKVEGVTYSDQKITMTVVVEEDDTENLVIKSVSYTGGSGDNGDVITNTYREAETTLHAKKVVSGKGAPKETFTFNLTAASDGAPLPTEDGRSIAVKDGETKDFGKITFREAGTYEYQITEELPAAEDQTPGMTYADKPITVTVVVSEKDGALSVADPVYKDANGVETYTITNTYEKNKVKAQPQVQKKIAGNQAPSDVKFTFTISGVGETALPDSYETTRTVVGEGTATFAEIVYEEAGTYVYQIVESVVDEDKVEGMTYSTQIVTMTVTVSEDAKGVLSREVAYTTTTDGAAGEGNTITNTYQEVKTKLHVTKAVTGNTAPDEAFTLI